MSSSLIRRSLRKLAVAIRFHGSASPVTESLSVTSTLPVTTVLDIVDTASKDKIPVYRILDLNGIPLPGAVVPKLDPEVARTMYKLMIRVQAVDDVFYNAQRQGRLSFYMQNNGEEAIQIGCASALNANDTLLLQYRELGVLLYRGFTVQNAADQCFGNSSDTGKGRMMPVHYGSKAHK